MLTKIVSFGYKHPLPPLQLSGYAVVDIRHMFENPHKIPRLRGLNGKDQDVKNHIIAGKDFVAMYMHVLQRITAPGIHTAYIGCVGGKHRSVFLAEELAAELKIAVEHRDLNK